jgi:hypothetical protein
VSVSSVEHIVEFAVLRTREEHGRPAGNGGRATPQTSRCACILQAASYHRLVHA